MNENGDWHSDQSVTSIFSAAAELASSTERAAYLDRACGGDAALRAQVDKLLDAQARAGDFMRDPVHRAAGDELGSRIGPYKLLQVIGEGGMGSVYMAEQTHPVERRVALKVVKPGMDSSEIIARFEAERQALALMDHPNIAKVFDAGATEKGRPYFAMELVKGVPITEYCDQRGFGPRQRVELFARVCHAVHHAHQKGIIHRDLKPANVLVAEYDNAAVPKIIDFGIAKAFGLKLTDKTMFTQYGQIVGSFEYMSPEQAKFNQLDVDTRSDIYALGVLLYELLAGTTPFDRGRLQVAGFEEILRIIREEEPPKPSMRISALGERTAFVSASRQSNPDQLRRDLHGELDWIVMRAMDKERNRRYESAAAFAEDIERFLNDEAVEACPPSKTYLAKKFVRRHRGLVIAVSAVFAVLVLGLVGTILGLFKATAAEELAQSERDAQQRLNFRMAVDRGLILCEDGHVGHGLLWLGRALELCPPDDPAMERLVRVNLNAWRRELNTLEVVFPHEAPVTSIAVSPRGDRLVTGCWDGVAQLWDTRTGERVGEPLKHHGDVHEVAFSADGSRLLTADFHTTAAYLWDTETGDRIRTFDHAENVPLPKFVRLAASGGVQGAAFRPPHDAQIVLGCGGDGVVTIWDADSGELLAALPEHGNTVHDVAVSPDGRYILTASHANIAVLWDVESRERLATIRHDARVGTAAFLPGGRIVTGDGSGGVYVWSIAAALKDDDKTLETSKGESLFRPWMHKGVVHRLRVSPDGTLVAIASFDNTARILDPDRNAPVGPAFEHEGQVQSVAWTPDGKRIATGCDDNVARLWRPAAGQSVHVVQHEEVEQEAVYTKDGRFVLIKKGDEAVVRDALTKVRLCTVRHEGGIRAVAVSPDRSRVLTGGTDSTSRLFDGATGEPVFPKFREGGGGVWSVDISADGTRMIASSFGGTVNVRDVRTGKLVRPVTIPGRAQGIAFSPDGARFAVTGNDKLCRIFAVDGPPVKLRGHRSTIGAVAFSGDGARVATGGMDNAARVWDAATGAPLSEFMRQPSPIQIGVCVALSADGRMVATASSDGTVRVWDVATSQPIGPALVQESGSGMVAFTRDGQVQAGSLAGAVRVWDAERSPLQGDAEHIQLWAQVITGFELDAEGTRRALDGHVWRERRTRLEQLGGAPSGRK